MARNVIDAIQSIYRHILIQVDFFLTKRTLYILELNFINNNQIWHLDGDSSSKSKRLKTSDATEGNSISKEDIAVNDQVVPFLLTKVRGIPAKFNENSFAVGLKGELQELNWGKQKERKVSTKVRQGYGGDRKQRVTRGGVWIRANGICILFCLPCLLQNYLSQLCFISLIKDILSSKMGDLQASVQV